LEEKMKKIGLVFCIILFGCLVSSCVSPSTFVWDDTIPPEQSAKIHFIYFTPTSFNGINVNPKATFSVFPAGNTTFSGNVRWLQGQGSTITYRFNVDGAVFSYNLEGGKEYTAIVGYQYNEEIKRRVWGIGLFRDITFGRMTTNDRHIGFIPFDPPVLSN
jgi:hypothetical protein